MDQKATYPCLWPVSLQRGGTNRKLISGRVKAPSLPTCLSSEALKASLAHEQVCLTSSLVQRAEASQGMTLVFPHKLSTSSWLVAILYCYLNTTLMILFALEEEKNHRRYKIAYYLPQRREQFP